MRTNHKYWCLWAVAADGTEPELQTGVFVAQPCVPHQQVDSSVRQEELEENYSASLDEVDSS